MIKIDAHQHFWIFDPVRDAWIDDSMHAIRKDFMPENLQPLLAENGLAGCVAVQADQSEKETDFLLALAGKHDFIKGVVGWVDICANDLPARLEHYTLNPLFKGVRHIAQAEADDFLARPDVCQGIAQLAPFDLTYDILVYQHQLPAVIQLVKQIPEQAFVLDHLAKPQASKSPDTDWVKNIKALAAASPNVYCKLSGLVTETAHFTWDKAQFAPFLSVVMDAFGPDRVMYGSDWPVCLLAADYASQLEIIEDFIADFSEEDQAKIMGGNAINFYHLEL